MTLLEMQHVFRYEITFDHGGVLAGWFAIWPSKSITVSQRIGRVDGIGTDVWRGGGRG